MAQRYAKANLKDRLEARARELGFVAFGVASARGDSLRSSRLYGWLEAGHHGSMDWMSARAEKRQAPQALWPEARSVIALGMSYAPDTDPLGLEGHPEKGRISVYARGKDYHQILKKKLKALARWLIDQEPDTDLKIFVDTAPVMEKPLGEAAGIGWQGKHTNLVSREHGNWLFLGSIYTTLELETDQTHSDSCGTCDACQVACPTDAFPAPYQLDARRCISYLTIEHKGPVPKEFRKALGNRIYGCDDCLAVCPWNKFAKAASANYSFAAKSGLNEPKLEQLLGLNDATFRSMFSGSPIKRIGRDRFVRNCLYAAGNSNDSSLVHRIKVLKEDPNPIVSEAAQWAIEQLTANL